MNELLDSLERCPFCGGKADIYVGGENWVVVECMRCGSCSGYYNTREEAAEAWNRRAEK